MVVGKPVLSDMLVTASALHGVEFEFVFGSAYIKFMVHSFRSWTPQLRVEAAGQGEFRYCFTVDGSYRKALIKFCCMH